MEQIDGFLNVEGVEGESIDEKHPGQIVILGWEWRVRQSGGEHDQGTGSGTASVGNVRITKLIDTASPRLLELCCKGEMVNQAVLSLRKGSNQNSDFLTIRLEDVRVVDIFPHSIEGKAMNCEEVALNFKRFRFRYAHIWNGEIEGNYNFGWDITKNQAN